MSPSGFHQHFMEFGWEGTGVGARLGWSSDLNRAVQFMMDTAQPTFLVWGDEMTMLFNEPFALLLGERWHEALGTSYPSTFKPIWEILAPFAEAAYSGRGGLVRDVSIPSWESRFNERRNYTFSFTPIRDSAGEVLGATCICTDTTREVERSQEVKRELRQLYDLFEHTPGFIAIGYGPEHRFTFANRSYRELTGIDDLVGRTVSDVMPELASQGFIEKLDQVYATGQPFYADEVPMYLAGNLEGDCRYLSFVYEAIRDESGEVCGIFCEGFDVTEARSARNKVEALQSEMIQASRQVAVGALASTLAHELNQPLATISNYASAALILLQNGEADQAAVRQCVEGVRSATESAGKIFQSVRRLAAAKDPNTETINLEDLIRGAVALALPQLSGQNVAVKYSFGKTLMVEADPIQVQQALINLIRNAKDAMQDVPHPELTITTERSPSGVRICVEDCGGGISPEVMPHIFDAFVGTKSEGMGIGLSITRTIAEAHGGSLSAYNNARGGATFCLVLPVQSAD